MLILAREAPYLTLNSGMRSLAIKSALFEISSAADFISCRNSATRAFALGSRSNRPTI